MNLMSSVDFVEKINGWLIGWCDDDGVMNDNDFNEFRIDDLQGSINICHIDLISFPAEHEYKLPSFYKVLYACYGFHVVKHRLNTVRALIDGAETNNLQIR